MAMSRQKQSPRVMRALELTEDMVETVYYVYEDPDFVEIKGETGGDMVCYRVYNDGGIYAK